MFHATFLLKRSLRDFWLFSVMHFERFQSKIDKPQPKPGQVKQTLGLRLSKQSPPCPSLSHPMYGHKKYPQPHT